MQPAVEQLLRSHIRLIDDWPAVGVKFQDLTGLMADGPAFSAVIRELNSGLGTEDIDQVVGIEARGFPYGAALANSRGAGFITARKPGKLPGAVHALEYELEYGTATLELHQDALGPERRVVIVDDVLATGGTAGACIDLVRRSGAEIVALMVIMEIGFLNGRERITERGVPVIALLSA
ncbi:MAG: adenine phosphoribosyltransferase [Candidatus Nanopelagicales bacterium]